LIIGHEMVTALCLAAKSGVDVRIITPHHPDKWYVHTVSRSYYRTLVESGVKVYEYLPGFIHSKTFVVDDEYGVVGTINLDYRSLYLHFECGVWLYRCGCILDIKNDFEDTLKVCQEITLDDIRKIHPAKTMLMSVLRLFAPLM
ncbi:MAG: phospholipase D-like domain-containing protein, partial [Bacillota bacterium]